MVSIPPAPLLWQNKLALDFTHSQLAYVGYEGTVFHLSGPFAPVIGAQPGVVVQNIAHLDPPFKMLDNRGARQDGTTWYDALYDPAEITMVVEISANNPEEFRKVVRSWWGAWDPRQTGKLCWFSPESGEWWALARLAKPVPDQYKRDFYESGRVEYTWTVQNDNAFWFGPPSVCSITNDQQIHLTDDFGTYFKTGLGPSWTQENTGPGGMSVSGEGILLWQPSGTSTGTAIAQWNNATTDSDDQFISVTVAGDMPQSTDTVQIVDIVGNPVEGTFTLTLDGHTTQAMGGLTPAWVMQLELEALPNVGVGNVNVTGSGWFGLEPYTVTFVGDLGNQVVSTMTATTDFTYATGDEPDGDQVTVTSTTVGEASYIDLWGRLNNSGTMAQYGVRARFGYKTVSLSVMQDGAEYDLWSGGCQPITSGDVLSLQCGVVNPFQASLDELFTGTNWNPDRYQIYQNGFPLIPGGLVSQIADFFGTEFGYADTSGHSTYGPSYRGVGFGMVAGANGTSQLPPPALSKFSAGVGTPFLTLTNIGDQPGFPSYLCYGPGTFSIGDAGTNNMITIGPLAEGQIALLNTNPRLAPVVDLTPPASPVASKNFWQQLETATEEFEQWLVDFVTNNNLPPLLEQWQSAFGVTPPLAPVSTLLKSRFTQTIPAMREQEGPTTVQIPCQIQGGSSKSKIIASLTPMRRWPE